MNFFNIYMLMAAAILLMALFMRGNVPQNKKFVIWSCLIMFVVYGLRDAYSIGGDSSSSYLHQFQRMETTTWSNLLNGQEFNDNLMWQITVKLGFDLLGGDYQLFISLISSLVMLIFGRFIFRYSVNPVQSFVYYWGLWFFTFNINSLKQSIAMSLILLAFDSILERRLIRYLIVVSLAVMFHFPAIVFTPAYWLGRLNPKRYLVLLAAAFVVVYFFRDQIVEYVTQFYYEDREFAGEDRFWTGKVIVMLSLVLIAYFLRRPSKEDVVYAASMQFVAIATVIQLFSVYNNVFERLADYYFQFSVIFVPFVFVPKTQERREIMKADLFKIGAYVLCALCLYRFNDIVTRASSKLLPYQFFFQ